MTLEHPDKLIADVNEAAAALARLPDGHRLAQSVIQLRDLQGKTHLALEAATTFAEKAAAPVAVKPLEWGRDSGGYTRAETPFGQYTIMGPFDSSEPWQWGAPQENLHREEATFEAAKAAAQADYEQRVRSAILAPSAAPTPTRGVIGRIQSAYDILCSGEPPYSARECSASLLLAYALDNIAAVTPDAKAGLEAAFHRRGEVIVEWSARALTAEAQLAALDKSGNAELIEAAEMDPRGEREQWGMTFALEQFAAGLGVEKWEGGDGSESVEGDVWAEFYNIAKAGGFLTPDGDTFLNMGADALRAALRSPAAWQPIATLPTDDRLIMAYCRPDAVFPKGRMMIWKASFLAEQFRRIASGIPQPDHLSYPATHWRELPGPPLPSGGEDA